MLPEQAMIEPTSATWEAVTIWAEREIVSALDAIVARGLGPVETEYLRGRVATLRDILALPQPVTSFVTDQDDYVHVR